MEQGFKEDWNKYKERLINYGYTEEQIEAVKVVRESDEYELCPFEQFDFLFRQGAVQRTRKLRKPRNLFVSQQGQFFYLNHYLKKMEYIGYFKNEEE